MAFASFALCAVSVEGKERTTGPGGVEASSAIRTHMRSALREEAKLSPTSTPSFSAVLGFKHFRSVGSPKSVTNFLSPPYLT